MPEKEDEMGKDPVQGFKFETVSEDPQLASRNDTVCQIIGRVESDETMAYGPMFRVRFGDNFETTASSDELRPWFQID